MANFLSSQLSCPKIPKLGDILQFTVTHINSINNFYIQLIDEDLMAKLDRITEVGKQSQHAPDISNVEECELFLIRDIKREFLRVQVTQRNPNSRSATLKLIDEGTEIFDVDYSRLLPFSEQLIFAPLSHRASLFGIVPNAGYETHCRDCFAEFVSEDSIFQGKVKDLHASLMAVSIEMLFDDSNTDNSVNALLLETNFCTSIRKFPTNGVNSNKPHPIAKLTESESMSDNNQQSELYDFSFGQNSTRQRTAEEAISGLSGSICSFYQTKGFCKFGSKCQFLHDVEKGAAVTANVERSDPFEGLDDVPESSFDVELTHFESPSLFYLKRKCESESDVVSFREYCNRKYNSKDMLMQHEGEPCYPAVGEMIAAYDDTLHNWIRAKLLYFDSDTDEGVLFDVDSGRDSTVSFERMRRLPKQFNMKPKVFAARLEVRPLAMKSWNEGVIELVKNSLLASERIICSIESVLPDGFQIVSLTTWPATENMTDLLIENNLAVEYQSPILSEHLTVIPG